MPKSKSFSKIGQEKTLEPVRKETPKREEPEITHPIESGDKAKERSMSK